MYKSLLRLALGAVVVLSIGTIGCGPGSPTEAMQQKDPFTDMDLRISQQLDLGRLYGEVVNKRIGYYAQAHPDADATVGQSYYCLDIRTTDTANQVTVTMYCGVRQIVYDLVQIGTKLPLERTYNAYEIAQLHGRIVDRRAEPEKLVWYIVVDHASEVKVYRVDPQSYYRHLEFGLVLPFTPPRGGMTASGDPEPVTAGAP